MFKTKSLLVTFQNLAITNPFAPARRFTVA
jgi:hypothetical protein